MGRELFQTSAVFRKSILELDAIYKSVIGQSLIKLTGIFDGARPSDPLGEIWPIAITLISLTMLQIALFDILAGLGIKPDVVVGHSAGETPLRRRDARLVRIWHGLPRAGDGARDCARKGHVSSRGGEGHDGRCFLLA